MHCLTSPFLSRTAGWNTGEPMAAVADYFFLSSSDSFFKFFDDFPSPHLRVLILKVTKACKEI
jgi:hypothetical protein